MTPQPRSPARGPFSSLRLRGRTASWREKVAEQAHTRRLLREKGPATAEKLRRASPELSSLVDVVRHSVAVLIAMRAAAPDLVELALKPALAATARFGIVTLARRAEPPALPIVRKLVSDLLRDQDVLTPPARADTR